MPRQKAWMLKQAPQEIELLQKPKIYSTPSVSRYFTRKIEAFMIVDGKFYFLPYKNIRPVYVINFEFFRINSILGNKKIRGTCRRRLVFGFVLQLHS